MSSGKVKVMKPMLAFNENPDLTKLRYPVLVSPKIDGFRCYRPEDKALSRSNKPIRNDFTREWVERYMFPGVDGELMVRGGVFNDCQSAFTTKAGKPDFQYWVFDLIGKDPTVQFKLRYANLCDEVAKHKHAEFTHRVVLVPHVLVNNEEELLALVDKWVDEGFEGAMIRALEGPYKFGRSTLNEGWLLKWKLWEDAEGIIIGLEEQMSNQNEKTVNELGHSERSSHKAGMVPAGTLGKFIIRNLKTGVEHAVGTGKGMDAALRKTIWDNKEAYMSQIITYKFQPHGTKDKPRIPVWKGFRSKEDMGE